MWHDYAQAPLQCGLGRGGGVYEVGVGWFLEGDSLALITATNPQLPALQQPPGQPLLSLSHGCNNIIAHFLILMATSGGFTGLNGSYHLQFRPGRAEAQRAPF